jgi:hypothetical protein
MRDVHRIARWALLLAVALVPLLMASPALAGTFVYVGNADSNEIYVLELDRQRGDLTLVEKVLIPGIEKPGNSTPMALSPDRRLEDPEHHLPVGDQDHLDPFGDVADRSPSPRRVVGAPLAQGVDQPAGSEKLHCARF